MLGTKNLACLMPLTRAVSFGAAAVLAAGSAGAASTRAHDFQSVYVFTDARIGQGPFGPLATDKAGNLYGTTAFGGLIFGGSGNVYKVTPDGTQTVLYDFSGAKDGQGPLSGLIADSAGNLYGTTYQGGANGLGTIFKVAPDGTETLLHNFAGGANDGSTPLYGVLIRHKTGDIIGTASTGGPINYGVVYKLSASGTLQILHAFGGGLADGCNPESNVIEDKAGNLYGTTSGCGAHGYGTVFKLAPDGTEKLLYSFQRGTDGATPRSAPIADKAGNFYGTTQYGGAADAGTVYKLAPDGTETVLYAFQGLQDGWEPIGGVFLAANGNLYGTTFGGGTASGGDGLGVVFMVKPDGTEKVLHRFIGQTDGCSPLGALIRNTGAGDKGYLYGTTSNGVGRCSGSPDYGTIFKIQQ